MTSERTMSQVRAILNKLDRSIDEARQRRTHEPDPDGSEPGRGPGSLATSPAGLPPPANGANGNPGPGPSDPAAAGRVAADFRPRGLHTAGHGPSSTAEPQQPRTDDNGQPGRPPRPGAVFGRAQPLHRPAAPGQNQPPPAWRDERPTGTTGR